MVNRNIHLLGDSNKNSAVLLFNHRTDFSDCHFYYDKTDEFTGSKAAPAIHPFSVSPDQSEIPLDSVDTSQMADGATIEPMTEIAFSLMAERAVLIPSRSCFRRRESPALLRVELSLRMCGEAAGKFLRWRQDNTHV